MSRRLGGSIINDYTTREQTTTAGSPPAFDFQDGSKETGVRRELCKAMGRDVDTSLNISANDLDGDDEKVPEIPNLVSLGGVPKPKRAVPAFQFYASEQRKKLKEEGDTTSTQTMKIIGASWKDLSNKDREKYAKLAAADKVHDEREMPLDGQVRDLGRYRNGHRP